MEEAATKSPKHKRVRKRLRVAHVRGGPITRRLYQYFIDFLRW